MPNQLATQESLYLRQHAENPVNWYPWGPEAFERAREEDKPILVSIGYSSCHWCHVMAHESFEDEYIAGLMNKHFICIKVDREERPDVDQIYMEAVQMLNGQGGWPLNVFCLPDGRPFAGGTYFPPDDRQAGLVPWPQLLMRIAHFFRSEREKLAENAASIVKNLEAGNSPPSRPDEGLSTEHLIPAAKAICREHDDRYGGFGQAPKFPPSMTLNFLLEMRNSAAVDNGPGDLRERIDQVVATTLTKMAQGGIYDQLGGGFARYSVDPYWLIPHFEKMLYDNALLIELYTKGWLRYRLPLFRAVVAETVEWLARELKAPGGAYYSSFDADSEGGEGSYYVWTPKEITDILGAEDGTLFCDLYSISEKGNFEHGTSNPALCNTDFQIRQKFAPHREKLLAARGHRSPPARDEKQLTSWNSLLLGNLAEAGFYFGMPEWIAEAHRGAEWIWENMGHSYDRLHAVYYGDKARLNGYLTDYTFFAEALLKIGSKIEWILPGEGARYLDRSRDLVDAVLAHFGDDDGASGFFFTSDDHETLVSRKKEWWDSAIPAGNSSLLHACAGLWALTGDSTYREVLNAQRKAYLVYAERAPSGIAHALAAYAGDAVGTVVVKCKGVGSLETLRSALAERPWRRTFLLTSDDAHQPDGYQLCIGTQCLAPKMDPLEIAPLIA